MVGLVNADTVTSVTLTSAGAAASATVALSPYTIVIGGALGTGLGNYEITYENGSADRRPKAELTISATDQSRRTATRFVFDTSKPVADFERGRPGQRRHGHQRDPQQHRRGGQRRPSPSARTPSSSAARWAPASTTTRSPTRTASLTVDPRPLTIGATDQSKTYGDTVHVRHHNPSLDFDVVGLVNADTVASVTLSSAGAAASATVAVSPYTIVIGGALGTGLGNYEITYENAS